MNEFTAISELTERLPAAYPMVDMEWPERFQTEAALPKYRYRTSSVNFLDIVQHKVVHGRGGRGYGNWCKPTGEKTQF